MPCPPTYWCGSINSIIHYVICRIRHHLPGIVKGAANPVATLAAQRYAAARVFKEFSQSNPASVDDAFVPLTFREIGDDFATLADQQNAPGA
jgi:hypothetical protein